MQWIHTAKELWLWLLSLCTDLLPPEESSGYVHQLANSLFLIFHLFI